MPLLSFRTHTASALGKVTEFLERRPWTGALLLTLVYVPCVLGASRLAPLSHDELFTAYISGAPTLGTLWADLRGFDLNPPLLYLLTRYTGHLDGGGALGLRLPDMLAFLVFLLAIYRFVRVRLGVMFGVFAGVLLMSSLLWELAFLARPYALLLGFLGLGLVGLQEVEAAAEGGADGRRKAGIGLLALAACGLVASHLFAVFGIVALAGAELWRARMRRRLDVTVLAALLGPMLALPVFLPMLRSHRASIFPVAFQPDGSTIFEFYTGSVEREMVVLGLTALLVLVTLGPEHLRGARTERRWFFRAPEWCGIILMIGLPLLLMAQLMLAHGAFFARYGATASVGVALLSTALLARWTLWQDRPDPRAALLGCVIALLTSGLAFAWPSAIGRGALWPTRAHSEPAMLLCQACAATAQRDAAIPLVDASGLTFVQMSHYESDRTMQRVFYLTDAAGSTQYAHANIFERMGDLVERFHLRGHVQRYGAFTAEHPHFFVFGRYDYPEDWLLRKLVAEGADVRMIGHVDDSYRDTELYEVRMR